MHTLNVLKFPDPGLRKKYINVLRVGDRERELLSKMAQTMYLSQGVGLAAIQVGSDLCMAVIDIGTGLMKLINPVITKKEGSEMQEEGCLSVPGTCVKVRRAKKVSISYMDEYGNTMKLKAVGLLARVMQHEIDHLSGKLIIDYLNPIKKLFIKPDKIRKKNLTFP